MQVQWQQRSLKQPVKQLPKQLVKNQQIQNDIASTATEVSGPKSIPFQSTPKIKIQEIPLKTSQSKLIQVKGDNQHLQQLNFSKPIFSPQHSPPLNLVNTPPQQWLGNSDFFRLSQQKGSRLIDRFANPPDSQSSVRGFLQREFYSDQLKQQQEQVSYSKNSNKILQQKALKDILDQQIIEKQKQIQREKEQKLLDQKLEEEKLQLEIRKKLEEQRSEKSSREKQFVQATSHQLSPENTETLKKTKTVAQQRISLKVPEITTLPSEFPGDDMIQNIFKENQQLKEENLKKDQMIEHLQKLNQSRSTKDFKVKTNARALVKSSQDTKPFTFKNRLPVITTPQPHVTHQRFLKPSTLEKKTQRVPLLKEEEYNLSFGKREETEQSLNNKKLFSTLSGRKIVTIQEKKEEPQVSQGFNSEWGNIDPGFTFSSSVAQQFKVNPKPIQKLKQIQKLPKEFQAAPLRRKYCV